MALSAAVYCIYLAYGLDIDMHKTCKFNWPPRQGHHAPRRANSGAAPDGTQSFSRINQNSTYMDLMVSSMFDDERMKLLVEFLNPLT